MANNGGGGSCPILNYSRPMLLHYFVVLLFLTLFGVLVANRKKTVDQIPMKSSVLAANKCSRLNNKSWIFDISLFM